MWDGREAVENPWCRLKSPRQSDFDSTLRAPRAGKRIELRYNRGNPERNERSGFRLIRCSLLRTEDPRSWRKFGSVVSAVEHASPIRTLRSKMVVLTPPTPARTIVAERPLGPEPIIVAVGMAPAKSSVDHA